MRWSSLLLGLAVALASCDFNPTEAQTCEVCTAKGPRCTFCGDGTCRSQGTYEFLDGNKCCTAESPCYSSKFLNCPSNKLQCESTREYGWADAPAMGNTVTISSSQETGEYATISNCILGRSYSATSTVATDFITVRSGTASGPVIAYGVAPVSFAAQATSTFLHYHLNSLCEGSNGGPYRTSSISSPLGCTGTSAYGSANAPNTRGEVTITTVQDPGEYATLSNIRAGGFYGVRVNGNDRFITIRFGAFNGPVVAAGMSPVEWVANQTAQFFAHFHVNDACAISPSGSRTSYLSNNRGECTATNTYGSVNAPAGGQTVEITSKQTVGEYATINNAGYNAPLRVTSSVATDYITVRVASPTGTVVAAGVQPIDFSATFEPSRYYLHFHSSRLCDVLDENYRTSRIQNLRKECTATLAYGNVNAPQPGETTTVTTKQLTNEYAQINNVVAARTYQFTSSRQGDFLTLRIGSATGPTIASGLSPVEYTAVESGTIFVHYFAGDDCEVDDFERVSTVVASEVGCLATLAWGSTFAPAPGETSVIDANTYAGEYGTVTAATVGSLFSAASTRTTDFITVRTGTYDGPILRTGVGSTSPFIAQHSSFFVHVHADRDCATDSTLRSLSVTGHFDEVAWFPWASAFYVKTSMHVQKTVTIHPAKTGAACILGAVAVVGLLQSRFAPRKQAAQPAESQAAALV